MGKNSKNTNGYIKTENTIILIALALIIGFVGGVIFSVYRLGSTAVPANGQSMPQTGISQMQQQQLNELQARIKKTPNDIEAWNQMGHMYFDTGQHQKAIEAYERSVALDSRQPEILTDLGVMYRRSGKPEKAVENFDKAIAINPKHEIALYNKGIVLMHDLKDMQGAINAWSQVLSINPNATTPAGDSLNKMVEQLKRNLSSSPSK